MPTLQSDTVTTAKHLPMLERNLQTLGTEHNSDPQPRWVSVAEAGILRKLGILCIPDMDDETLAQAEQQLAAVETSPVARELLADTARLARLTREARDEVHHRARYAIKSLEDLPELGDENTGNICNQWRLTLTRLEIARDALEPAIVTAEATLETLGTPPPPEGER